MQWSLAAPAMLRAVFTYNRHIVNRIKRIDGAQWSKEDHCWSVPATQVARAMELFPKAQFSYDVIALSVDMPRRRAETFIRNIERLGITLYPDNETGVVATGDGVSPVLENAIYDRREWLRPYVEQKPKNGAQSVEKGLEHTIRHARAGTHDDSPSAPASDDVWESAAGADWADRQKTTAEAYLAGMKNAATEAKRKERIVAAQRRRKNDVNLVQARLI